LSFARHALVGCICPLEPTTKTGSHCFRVFSSHSLLPGFSKCEPPSHPYQRDRRGPGFSRRGRNCHLRGCLLPFEDHRRVAMALGLVVSGFLFWYPWFAVL